MIMGLDNGITLVIKNEALFEDLPRWFKHFSKDDNEYDILYWRKCYNIRIEIISLLAYRCKVDADDNTTPIDLPTFEAILEMLDSCYNLEWWQENDDSIWDWDDFEEVEDEDGYLYLVNHGIGNSYRTAWGYAYALLEYLKTKPADSYELSFYDSY